jgi:hypothetical protein
VTHAAVAVKLLDKHVRGDATQTIGEMLQALFSVSPFRGYMTRPTESSSSRLSEVTLYTSTWRPFSGVVELFEFETAAFKDMG